MISLSVVIPIYNTPRYLLDHCLTSILDNIKDMKDVEVLMVNDGSNEPHIAPLLQETAQKDGRFRYIDKPNSGVSNTRNMGIRMSQGEYIAFVDADDYLEPDAFQYMLATAKKEQADVAMFGFCCDENRIERETLRQRIEVNEGVMHTLFSNDMSQWYKYGFNLASVWAKLYKRGVILQNNVSFIQDIAPNEDGFFNICLLSNIPSIYVDTTLVYHYVTNEDSALHKFSNYTIRIAEPLLTRLDESANTLYPNNDDFINDICSRTWWFIRDATILYFIHPQNEKPFWELKREMEDFLSKPIIRKYIKKTHLQDARKKIGIKKTILLKLHLYWIVLITGRRKRRRHVGFKNNNPIHESRTTR